MAAVGLFFFPKNTLDCDKMKWSSGTNRSCDLAQTTKRGRHMTRPPAARPSVYHLSHAERWHLFILPGPRLRNQFHSNTRPACNANVQYAAPSGTALRHISDVVIPRRCLWVVSSQDVLNRRLTWFLLWHADGVGERLRCHRHANPSFWKWSQAVSPLLAGWGVWRLPHIRGMSVNGSSVFLS